jgi:hypothetical protein
MSLLIEVPFLYDAKLVPPRKRNARNVKVLDCIPIVIQEKTTNDFPIAMQYVCGTHLPFDNDARKAALENAITLRWDGHSLHEAVGGAFLNREDLKRLLQDVENSPFRREQGFYNYNRWQYEGDPIPVNRIDGKVESDNRRERVATLLEMSSKMFVCDRHIWTQCNEPCWLLEAHRQYPSIKAVQTTEAKEFGGLFRADDLELAKADVSIEDLEIYGRIDVLIPEAVQRRPAEAYIVGAAKRFLESTKDSLGNSQVEFMVAYARLRDILMQNKELPDHELSPILVPLIREVPTLIDIRYTTENWEDYQTKSLRDALSAWEKEQEMHPSDNNEMLTPALRF